MGLQGNTPMYLTHNRYRDFISYEIPKCNTILQGTNE